MKVINPYKEAAEAIIVSGGEAFKSCYQCGLCTGTCPWNLVTSFITRKLIHQAQFGLVDLEGEEIWLCATCGACVEHCPRDVKIIDIIQAIRRIGVQWGVIPKTLKTTMTSIGTVGNPWGEAPEKRADWAGGLDIKMFTQGTELLYFPCCTPAYDPRGRRIATATVAIFKKVGADFGILGAEESCCGESVRKVGDESLFKKLAKNNIEAFKRWGVSKIVTTSPHCYHTFKNEYPELGGSFEIIHYTQYLARLIDEARLKLTTELGKRVAYHDPCYLGRHNKVYDEPRMILRSIPGLELVELPDFGQDSLCCGGGGGRMWMETKKEERFSDLLIEQALEVGADILATSCPYCIINLEDSVLTMDKADVIKVRDISELVQEVI